MQRPQIPQIQRPQKQQRRRQPPQHPESREPLHTDAGAFYLSLLRIVLLSQIRNVQFAMRNGCAACAANFEWGKPQAPREFRLQWGLGR